MRAFNFTNFELNSEKLKSQNTQTISHIKLNLFSGLLLEICSTLLDSLMFSHESFVAWEESNDPAEQEGKGEFNLHLSLCNYSYLTSTVSFYYPFVLCVLIQY